MQGLPEPKPATDVRTETSSDTPKGVLLPAVSTLGLSMFVFGAVFFLSTLLVTLFITPDRFPVRMGEQILQVKDLESEQQRLAARKADLLTLRTQLTADIKSPVLHQVARLKGDFFPVGKILNAIEQVRQSFKSSSADPISFPSVEVSGTEGKILLSGAVRDPDGRSIQLLASFIDGLRALPNVQSVSEPEYAQHPDANETTVSPFSITIVLKHG